jgi:hypothetical protein
MKYFKAAAISVDEIAFGMRSQSGQETGSVQQPDALPVIGTECGEVDLFATELGSHDGAVGIVVSETSFPDPHRKNKKEHRSFYSDEGPSAEFSAQYALGRGLDAELQRSSNTKFSEK